MNNATLESYTVGEILIKCLINPIYKQFLY